MKVRGYRLKITKKRLITASALCALLVVGGCTDAARARIGSYGDSGEIKCYSAGQLIYEGRSTGKIHANNHFSGFEFKDASTNKFVRIHADCVVNN